VNLSTVLNRQQAVRLLSEPNKFIWKWSPNSLYSWSFAYAALFLGRVDILGARQIWKTRMPRKCKFFAWIVLHGRCWTSDRLHRHGLKDSDTLRSKLWIICLSTMSSVERRGSEPSGIFFSLISPRIIPCLLLHGGTPPGSWSLKPEEKVLIPLSGWSLGRFGGSAIGTLTTGKP
jgi:hypothetical protein